MWIFFPYTSHKHKGWLQGTFTNYQLYTPLKGKTVSTMMQKVTEEVAAKNE
jgi:hypothetical protein